MKNGRGSLMASVMRTFLIARTKNNELLYGHSIVWELSGLDYVIDTWKKCQLGEISIYFKDLRDGAEVNAALKEGIFNLAPELDICISLDLPESETFFIEKSYDEENFNPLSGLCSFATVYFRELSADSGDLADVPRRYKEAFERIKDDFHIDILATPHLLGSFTVFRPTRIEEEFQGFQSDTAAGYRIRLLDYFQLYEGAKVCLKAVAGHDTHTTELTLDDELHVIDCGFVPDRHVTAIELNGQIIYRSSFSLVKHINFTAHVVEEKKVRIGDKVIVQKRSSEDRFDV